VRIGCARLWRISPSSISRIAAALGYVSAFELGHGCPKALETEKAREFLGINHRAADLIL